MSSPLSAVISTATAVALALSLSVPSAASDDPLRSVESTKTSSTEHNFDAGRAIMEPVTAETIDSSVAEPTAPPVPVADASNSASEIPAAIADAEEAPETETSHLAGSFIDTFILGTGDDFGLFSIESQQHDANPFKDAAIRSAQPGWGVTWLNGPDTADLPPQLYQFTLPIEFDAINEQAWTLSVMLTPGWFTDGENRRPEMFRMLGAVTANYRQSEAMQFGLGLLYLDRDDIPALPLFGLLFESGEAPIRYELIFPSPRVVWTFADNPHSRFTAYLSGELGGGSYAIKRTDRTPDVVTLRDLRLIAGVDLADHRGRKAAVEAGWIFDRAIESRTGRGDYDPPAAFMARLRLEY